MLVASFLLLFFWKLGSSLFMEMFSNYFFHPISFRTSIISIFLVIPFFSTFFIDLIREYVLFIFILR